MKSIGICRAIFALILAALPLGSSQAGGIPARLVQLDGLASDISLLGFVPSGGDLKVLSVQNQWFGSLSGVRLLPGDSAELASLLTDTTGAVSYYGIAQWSPGGDVVIVTAPEPSCLPSGVQPFLPEGSEVRFHLAGIEHLDTPRLAVLAPTLDISEIQPDSSGQFSFHLTGRGVYWVEVMQQTPSGPSVELLFPVVSGGDAADVLSGEMMMMRSDAASPEEVLEELNELRELMGVTRLSRSAGLDSAASIRAGNLALAGSSSHFGHETGSLQQVLPGEFHFYGENIGRGRGYQEAWSIILISPFHLRTCLSAEYSHVGIAGAVDSDVFEWQLVLVQVFAAEEDPD